MTIFMSYNFFFFSSFLGSLLLPTLALFPIYLLKEEKWLSRFVYVSLTMGYSLKCCIYKSGNSPKYIPKF